MEHTNQVFIVIPYGLGVLLMLHYIDHIPFGYALLALSGLTQPWRNLAIRLWPGIHTLAINFVFELAELPDLDHYLQGTDCP